MKIVTLNVGGFDAAFQGMRNPMNSWNKSDSSIGRDFKYLRHNYIIGKEDLKLAQALIKAGNEHAKFLRMIHVWADAEMPRYIWSEWDTYKFNTKNSCSTMHRLLNNKEKITKDYFLTCEEDDDVMEFLIDRLNELREEFLKTKKDELLIRAKRLLPEGFLQLRTVDTNYAELRNMYFQRRNHRLKEEWQNVFCKWLETLPYAKELILFEG